MTSSKCCIRQLFSQILVIAQKVQNTTIQSSDDLTMNFSTSANVYKLNLLKRQLEEKRMQEAKILQIYLKKKSHAKTTKKPLASITNDLNYESSSSVTMYKLNLIEKELNEKQNTEMKKMKNVPMERHCVNLIAKKWNGSTSIQVRPANIEEFDLPRGMVIAMRDRLEKDEKNNDPRKQVDDRPTFSQMRARWLKECESHQYARTSNNPS